VSKLGIYTGDLEFVKVPVFGWFAKNKQTGVVTSLVSYFDVSHYRKLYGIIHRDFSDCIDFKMTYAEHAEKELYSDILKQRTMAHVLKMAQDDIPAARARMGEQITTIPAYLAAKGKGQLVSNGLGFVSTRVFDAIPASLTTHLHKYKGAKSVLLPSYCAPGVICSLQIMRVDNMQVKDDLYLNDEYGWLGQWDKPVVSSSACLEQLEGCTWDYKLPYWYRDSSIELSMGLTGTQLLQIWSEQRDVRFSTDIVDLILRKIGTEDLITHFDRLSLPQIQTLEARTGEKLAQKWRASKDQQYSINGQVYLRRDNCYHVKTSTGLEQLTNFVIEIHKIKKVEDDYVWVGTLFTGGQSIAFEMGDRVFSSGYLFSQGIRRMFLDNGVGIPFINEPRARQLLMLIQLSSQGVTIQKEPIAKEATE